MEKNSGGCSPEARAEFYVLTQTIQEENRQGELRKATGRPVWMDFFLYVFVEPGACKT